MIPNILQLLTAAIREKRCVAIRYHDQRHVRVIEPHAIYTHESGELVMDAFQTVAIRPLAGNRRSGGRSA